MADDTLVISTKTNTVHFTKKINMGERGGRQYESEELGIFVQFDGDAVADPDGFAANARAGVTTAMVFVFKHLGLKFEVSDEQVVRELVEQAMPGTVAQAPQASAPPRNFPKQGQAAPQAAGDKRAPRTLGTWNGRKIDVVDGKFGPFVTSGKRAEGGQIKNITYDLYDTLTLEQAAALLS